METIVRHRDEGRASWMLNGLMVNKVTQEETGGSYGLMEHLVTAASNPPVHVQNEEEEGFYVLDGEIEFIVDGVSAHARSGTFAFVPRGATHTFKVLTDTARMLVIASAPGGAPAGGLESFFLDLSVPAEARVLPVPQPPDPEVVAAAAAPRRIELVGPPPA